MSPWSTRLAQTLRASGTMSWTQSRRPWRSCIRWVRKMPVLATKLRPFFPMLFSEQCRRTPTKCARLCSENKVKLLAETITSWACLGKLPTFPLCRHWKSHGRHTLRNTHRQTPDKPRPGTTAQPTHNIRDNMSNVWIAGVAWDKNEQTSLVV